MHSSPCTRLHWQGRGVSHGFISDKLKEDKLAAFPFLFFFFCLVAIAAGRVGWGQDISGLQRMWTERRRCLSLSWPSCMNPFSPQSIPPSTQIWFKLSFFFSLLWNLTPKQLVKKKKNCLKCVWRQLSRKWSFWQGWCFSSEFLP